MPDYLRPVFSIRDWPWTNWAVVGLVVGLSGCCLGAAVGLGMVWTAAYLPNVLGAVWVGFWTLAIFLSVYACLWLPWAMAERIRQPRDDWRLLLVQAFGGVCFFLAMAIA